MPVRHSYPARRSLYAKYNAKRSKTRKYLRTTAVMRARTGLGPGARAEVRAIRRYVKAEIARNIENKTSQYFYEVPMMTSAPADHSVYNNLIQIGPDALEMQIGQGTGQGQRIGNNIKTKALMFKGTLFPSGLQTTGTPPTVFPNSFPCPVQVRMVLFYDKTDPVAEPDIWSNFFQNGNTTTGPRNNLTDMWAPINTDRYVVHYQRLFKLGYDNYAPISSAQPGLDPTTKPQNYFANNDFDFNQNFSINCTDYYPKNVTYQDGSLTPTTRGLWAVFLVAAANGGQLPTSNFPCRVQYMVDYKYEDA